MPRIYPMDKPEAQKEATGVKKTFGVYQAPPRTSRALIIAFVTAVICFVILVIVLVGR